MPFEIVKPGTEIDFVGRRGIAAVISVSLILIGLIALPVRGFRTGIDFAGGTELQLRFADTTTAGEGAIRAVLEQLEVDGASVVRFGGDDSNEFLVKVPGELGKAVHHEDAAAAEGGAEETGAEPSEAAESVTLPEERIEFLNTLESTLAEAIGPVSIERVEFVGPKVGAELRRDGLMSLGIACLAILVYIGFRFSLRFAPGAVVALVHDVLITSGIWVICGFEFDLRVLAALLAIIGYSLNDTIIVYDRIRENMEVRTKHALHDVLNLSVNQTLSRTVLTSVTTLLTLLALLLFGGSVIQPFALTMAIGVLVGTYSSIFIAPPTLLLLEERFGDSPATGKTAGAKA